MQDGFARQQTLALATVKGYTGHQEAGAGVAGLMEALRLVSHAGVPPALHLRTLNPHVAAILKGRAVAIARGGPAPVGQVSLQGLLVTGVSSFGAQGTNAHALLRGTNDAVGALQGRVNVVLHKARFWIAPAMQVSHVMHCACNQHHSALFVIFFVIFFVHAFYLQSAQFCFDSTFLW